MSFRRVFGGQVFDSPFRPLDMRDDQATQLEALLSEMGKLGLVACDDAFICTLKVPEDGYYVLQPHLVIDRFGRAHFRTSKKGRAELQARENNSKYGLLVKGEERSVPLQAGGKDTLVSAGRPDRPSQPLLSCPKGEDLISNAQVTPDA